MANNTPAATNPVNIQRGVVGNLKVNNFDSGQHANAGTHWTGDGHWRGAGKQRSITVSGNLPIVQSDSVLTINATTDLTPILPLASTRNGAALTLKNLTTSHFQTVTRTAPDTIDAQTTYLLATGASLTVVPFTDGVNSGWFIT